MCRAPELDARQQALGDEEYRKRLAYGTDQGRWLMEQVQNDAAKQRKNKPPVRAFHDMNEVDLQGEGDAKKPDALAVRQGALSGMTAAPWQVTLRRVSIRDVGICAVSFLVLYLIFPLWLVIVLFGGGWYVWRNVLCHWECFQ